MLTSVGDAFDSLRLAVFWTRPILKCTNSINYNDVQLKKLGIRQRMLSLIMFDTKHPNGI